MRVRRGATIGGALKSRFVGNAFRAKRHLHFNWMYQITLLPDGSAGQGGHGLPELFLRVRNNIIRYYIVRSLVSRPRATPDRSTARPDDARQDRIARRRRRYREIEFNSFNDLIPRRKTEYIRARSTHVRVTSSARAQRTRHKNAFANT